MSSTLGEWRRMIWKGPVKIEMAQCSFVGVSNWSGKSKCGFWERRISIVRKDSE